jgi:hypothetical protein
MKKYSLIAFMFIITKIAAFGDGFPHRGNFSLNGGVGGILGGHFTRYSIEAGKEDRLKADQNINQFEYGIFAFFDATFVTLGIVYQNGINSFDEPMYINDERMDDLCRSGQGWENVLGFSLLGKYPIQMSDRLNIFPLLGIDYHISLSQRRTGLDGAVYDRNNPPDNLLFFYSGGPFSFKDWNALFIRIGGGLEFNLTDKFFLRGDLLYGIRLMTEYERKNLDMVKELADDTSPGLGGLSSGPSIRLSAGWRFYTR